MKKRILSVLLVLALSSGYSLQVFATTAEEVREEQEKTEEQLNELNEQMENMEDQRAACCYRRCCVRCWWRGW